MLYYQAKEYHDKDIPRICPLEVIVDDELFTEDEFDNLYLPRSWFRRIAAKSNDTYVFFGARFVDDKDRTIIDEEDLT